ncbi:MAG: aspartate kinase, partial [Solobacterium sp.]|nr:aspartate kinase [Solobacterium sp.]
MIVSKFGGSSVASKEQFEKVKRIVDANTNRKFIVVSACGKENRDDYKVTDLLYLLHAHINYGVSYETIFNLVKEKYQRICDSLGLRIDLEKEFASVKEMLDAHAPVDYIVSRGEYLTARCMAEYLGAEFLDAKDVIAFKYNGDFDFDKIKQNLNKVMDMDKKYVIPGFYGALPNGQIKVMSRGGSDITGSILANIVDAEVYENWTDVSGILVSDPRIIDNPQQIPV